MRKSEKDLLSYLNKSSVTTTQYEQLYAFRSFDNSKVISDIILLNTDAILGTQRFIYIYIYM